jgi:hypothetical protein
VLRSLDHQDIAPQEQFNLKGAITHLESAHEALDMAIIRLHRRSMGMHPYRPSARPNRLKDPLRRAIAERFGRRLVALRTGAKLSRHEVVLRTRFYWGRMRDLEEGWQVPALDDVLKLAALYGVSAEGLFREATTGSDNVRLKPAPKCLWLTAREGWASGVAVGGAAGARAAETYVRNHRISSRT